MDLHRSKVNNVKKLIDSKGYFKRFLELKRLEKYANEIDMVLTKYNKKSCDETMMVKGLRKSCATTTNRKIHQEDLEKIVKEIAKKVGLNEQVVGIMGKHHDIGHTFLGHSGEWMISSILDDMGMGCFCHNTIGARDLIYTNKVYDEIIAKIKVHNPDIKPAKLEKIRKSLWLVIDGINAHNGEKPEKEYIPAIQKAEKDFINEIISCYTIKGFDRKIVPATPEACLMRLADQISYIPLDMVDGLKEGLIRDDEGYIVSTLDNDYIEVLTKLGINEEEIKEANDKREYGKIAERLKEIFINDVIKNSTKRKITMSKETMQLMNALRNLNNEKAVNNVVLTEDQATYPPAIRNLMNKFSEILLDNKVLDYLTENNEHKNIDNVMDAYIGTPYEGFADYISNMNKEDVDFTITIVKEAARQSVEEELEIARQCVQQNKPYIDKQELGLNYDSKNARIRSYIEYYQNKLQKGELIGYTEEQKEKETFAIMHHIMDDKEKSNNNYLNIKERIAMELAANYISTLNDTEFIQLLRDTELITDEQNTSLTRKYRDIKNLKDEIYIQENWKTIKESQRKASLPEEQIMK